MTIVFQGKEDVNYILSSPRFSRSKSVAPSSCWIFYFIFFCIFGIVIIRFDYWPFLVIFCLRLESIVELKR